MNPPKPQEAPTDPSVSAGCFGFVIGALLAGSLTGLIMWKAWEEMAIGHDAGLYNPQTGWFEWKNERKR